MSLHVSNSLRTTSLLRRIPLLAGVIIFLGTQVVGIEAADRTAKKAKPQRIIIKPKGEVTPEQFEALKGKRRLLKRFERLGRMSVLEVDPAESMERALEQLQASGLVEFAEPDYPLRASVVPNDPHFASGLQWSLKNSSVGRDIHAAEGWDIIKSAPQVIVAVVDSGIRYTHQDLAENMWRNPGEIPDNGQDDDRNGLVDDVFGINAVNGTGNPMDDGDHGTHVAGIIGAVGNNGIGIAGVAWNVKLMACKFLDSEGYGFTSDAVDAIDYARENGAHVINASFGGEEYSAALFSAIQSARASGVIFVTAAGNEQMNIDSVPTYPACYNLDNIIVVGGSTRADGFDSSYSNYGGENVDLFAPGTSVYSTWGNSDSAYQSSTGTSMSAPHVAGAVALMRARYTNLTSAEIVTRLLASVDTLSAFTGRCRTGGRLNLGKALGPNPWPGFNASTLIGEPPLEVNFSNLSLGDIKGYTWDFGDGSEGSAEAQPHHVFTRAGEYHVQLTVAGNNGQSHSVTQVVRVVSNYQFRSEPYNWVPTTGMSRLTLADDGVSAPQTLPFEFDLYGIKRSSLCVSANGMLGFSSDGLGFPGNVSMPNAAAPNGVIAPFWDDLDPSATTGAGFIYTGTVGAAPNRRFVVTWDNVLRPAGSASYLRFQAILEEGGDIIFQYRQVEGGRGATIGLENAAGDMAALYSHNGSPKVLANLSAVRAGKKVFRYMLVKQSRISFDVSAGTPSPKVMLELENAGNANMQWSINSTPLWVAAATPTGTLNAGSTTQIELQLTPEALALAGGSYETTLNILNVSDNHGSVSLPVSIQVQATSSRLELTPAETELFTGGFGGPFTPENLAIQLRNSGGAALDWTGTADASWVEVFPPGGRLEPGESTMVMLAVSTNGAPLGAGIHSAMVEFRNAGVSDAARFTQPVQVQVNARLASTSVSMQNGEFQAEVPAPQSGSFLVEYSEDMVNWNYLNTVIAENGALNFSDPNSGEAQRFYRLRLIDLPAGMPQ